MTRLVTAALSHLGRLVATMVAVALAVGLASGTFMLTDTIGAALHRTTTPSALTFLPDALALLAGVAVVVGALLVGNTFSILMAQRTRQLGVLRAIGASRAQLRRLVLAEATAVGLGGSLAGVALGFAGAHALVGLARGVGVPIPAGSIVVRGDTVGASVLGGMAVTAAVALIPTWRATRVSPVTALTNHEPAGSPSPRRRVGAAGAAALAGALLLGAGAGSATMALGAAAVLVAVALVLPLIAGPLSWAIGAPLVALCGESAAVARRNVTANGRRTVATAAALVMAIGMVGVVAIVSASMRASATSAVGQTVRADLVVSPTDTTPSSLGVPLALAPRLRATPGVALVSQIGGGQWALHGAPEALLAIDPATVTQMHAVDAASASALRRLDNGGVLVRDTVAQHHGWKVGDVIPMTFARTGTRRLTIRGLYATTAVPTDYAITLKALVANYTHPLIIETDVKFLARMAPAAAEANVRRAVASAAQVKVSDRAQLIGSAQRHVDTLLTPLAAVLGLAVVIGLLGVANALSLSISERTAEIGLLRAVGMTRRQLRTVIRCESVMTAGIGAVLGVGLAVGWGWVAVTALRPRGLTTMAVPAGQLGVLAVAVTAAGVLASVLPARRVARLPILDAVHHGG